MPTTKAVSIQILTVSFVYYHYLLILKVYFSRTKRFLYIVDIKIFKMRHIFIFFLKILKINLVIGQTKSLLSKTVLLLAYKLNTNINFSTFFIPLHHFSIIMKFLFMLLINIQKQFSYQSTDKLLFSPFYAIQLFFLNTLLMVSY